MAHDIEDQRMFYVGAKPWHNVGVQLQAGVSISEAIEVIHPEILLKLKSFAGVETDNGLEYIEDPSSFKVVRSDGKILADVGKDYVLEQPSEVADWFSPFINSGLCELETGGILANGGKMWMLAKIADSESEVIKGDSVKGYLLMATSFDGSLSNTAGHTGIRVVCNNTLAASLKADGSAMFKARHTSGLKIKLEQAQGIIGAQLASHKLEVEKYRTLARKPATHSQLKAYVERVIIPDNQKIDDISGKMKAKVERVIDLIDRQRGLDLVPAARGTYWQGYNAITEYVTHEAGRNLDTRLSGQFWGEGQKLNQRALNMALAA